MHKLNVLILGPKSFTSTLDELKSFLKFIPHFNASNIKYDVILFHREALENKLNKQLLDKSNVLKICATNKKEKMNTEENYLELPTTLKQLNSIVESVSVKKKFNENSSIKINDYTLDKNEKKLTKENNFVILTEKEIQLLELFSNHKKPISKDKILSSVWQYSSDADTHTVETHIYRLRKKINNKFIDDKFILNNKEGYYL
jgi:DNA-binding response OmpR family regulator